MLYIILFALSITNIIYANTDLKNKIDSAPLIPNIVHWTFNNNKIQYIIPEGSVPSTNIRTKNWLNIFENLKKQHALPNMKFLMGLLDFGPLEHDLPTITRSTNINIEANLVVPLESYFNRDIRNLVKTVTKVPWRSKKSKLFWRGSLTGHLDINNISSNIRALACIKSKNNPSLLDIKFTRDLKNKEFANKYSYLFTKDAKLDDYVNYKYILALDGWTGPSLLWWALFSNSVVFRHESPWRYHFEALLEPYIHYIPVREDLSDLEEKIRWAETHQAKCLEIIKNANKFAYKNLTPKALYNYLALILDKYSKLMES